MRLVKYSASGNDFLILNADCIDGECRGELAKRVCDRHNGIGADGLVVLTFTPNHPSYAYKWDFYNSDGSSAKMCGNASRSVGHYAYVEGLALRKHNFLSGSGVIGIEIDSENPALVQSDLGICKLLQEDIIESNPYGVVQWYLFDMGVPHLVGFVQNLSSLPTRKDSHLEALRKAYDANVNLACVESMPFHPIDASVCQSPLLYKENEQVIRFLSYERGVEDITQACGTGSASVFAMAYKLGFCGERAILLPPSGERLGLTMGQDSHIFFKGKVCRIASCEWLL